VNGLEIVELGDCAFKCYLAAYLVDPDPADRHQTGEMVALVGLDDEMRHALRARVDHDV
jgi:hypothetical protein